MPEGWYDKLYDEIKELRREVAAARAATTHSIFSSISLSVAVIAGLLSWLWFGVIVPLKADYSTIQHDLADKASIASVNRVVDEINSNIREINRKLFGGK